MLIWTLPCVSVLLMAPDAETSAKAEVSSAAKSESRRADLKPRNHDLAISIAVGAMLPSNNVDLAQGAQFGKDYDPAAAQFGLRVGYYPMRFLGLEAEGTLIPTRAEGDPALVYAARAQGVLQLGLWRVYPFVLLGGGVLGVTSRDSVAGDDPDPALHFGLGLKAHLTERVGIRLDVRDVVSPGQDGDLAHNLEALFAVAFRFGVEPKPKAPPPPPDEDGDGVADSDDWCPKVPGEDGKGCPWPDNDCDSVTDNVDRCPDTPGVGPDGCPLPDKDEDGILDASDECPEQAGPGPSGCPNIDSDGDRFFDREDKCPQEPETYNGVEDDDGCPDELPEEVKQFTGVIQGIFFDTGKAKIKATSETVLDNVVRVLKDYPQLKLEISGHTDSRGNADRNRKLSSERAEAVKQYLVDKGVAAERLRTRGAGPDEPIAENNTRRGRAKNRRIEFQIQTQ